MYEGISQFLFDESPFFMVKKSNNIVVVRRDTDFELCINNFLTNKIFHFVHWFKLLVNLRDRTFYENRDLTRYNSFLSDQ